MKKRYSIPFSLSMGAAATLPANAADLALKLQLPEITTGQYVRPYVAIWLEKADGTFVKNLALWHEVKDKRGNPVSTDKYLKNLRSWWSKSGASADMKFDSISSATRPAGEHEVVFTPGKAPLENLVPGKYQLMIEVAREVKAPKSADPSAPKAKKVDVAEAAPALSFDWPAKQVVTSEARGKAEIGAMSLTVKP